jgi:hypothetical protein
MPPNVPRGTPDAIARQVWQRWVERHSPGTTPEVIERVTMASSADWRPERMLDTETVVFHLKAREYVLVLLAALKDAAAENAALKHA